MARRYFLIAALVVGAGLAPAMAETKPKQKVQPMVLPNFNQPDVSVANSGYALTPEDLKLDCKKLTGKIQVGILQLRAERGSAKTTELSRSMQQAAAPFVAGSTHGISPEGDQARQYSQLKAYNGQLAAKNCPVYDLDSDLKPGATDTPRPIPKVKAAKSMSGARSPAPAAKAP